MKDTKKFEKPTAIVIEFEDNDIITDSIGDINYPWWGGGFDGPDTPVGR